MWNDTKPDNANKIADLNFETAPYSLKFGYQRTEISRQNATISNSETLDLALETLTQKCLKSNYPKI